MFLRRISALESDSKEPEQVSMKSVAERDEMQQDRVEVKLSQALVRVEVAEHQPPAPDSDNSDSVGNDTGHVLLVLRLLTTLPCVVVQINPSRGTRGGICVRRQIAHSATHI